jgi:SAM-dependent methyltransferase
MSGPYAPDLYDTNTPGTFLGDIEWYRAKARERGGAVLELGAGTGRITLPIAQDGSRIHALEIDAGMREALERKLARLPGEVRERVTVVAADMRTFELSERFSLIIAPFRVFCYNLTDDDRMACLRRVRQHLLPGGHFAFNLFHPSLYYMAQAAGALEGVWRCVSTVTMEDGSCIVRSESNRYDTVRQRVFSHHRYEQFRADGTLERTFLQRLELAYLYWPQLQHLLERAGFESIQVSGGFDGRPFERDTDELVIEAS